jgi:hypothetical protein
MARAINDTSKEFGSKEFGSKEFGSKDQGADITVLLTSINDHDDPRDAYALLQQRIHEYRSAGWSVPEELIRVERTMMTDFMAESQGR